MRGSFSARFFSSGREFFIDYYEAYSYIALAQSRTCLWVSADPSFGEGKVRYLELTPPVGQTANRLNRGHLEATTVRAFLVFCRLSKSRGY